MPASTTMTIRLKPELKDRLERLSEVTRRSNSFLAAEAIDIYVARELEILEMIEEGREAIRKGDTLSGDEVKEMLDALIEDTARQNA